MCTVTVVPHGDGFRLACNRDERRHRPAALTPHARRLTRAMATYPVDPLGGGTWVGVNDAGLAASLLNRTVDRGAPRRQPGQSRGLIVPYLLDCRSLADAIGRAADLDPTEFALFRVVLVQRGEAAELSSNGRTLSVDVASAARPCLLTSSSLGDHFVEAPRRALFERMVLPHHGAWAAAQTRFHAHQWASRPHVSVTMARLDARTVSRTVIDVTSAAIALRYEPLGSGSPRVVRVA